MIIGLLGPEGTYSQKAANQLEITAQLRFFDDLEEVIGAVLSNDVVYSEYKDVKDCPELVISRLKHYFLTYKDLPGNPRDCEITTVYGAKEAREIIKKSMQDYSERFDNLEHLLRTV